MRLLRLIALFGCMLVAQPDFATAQSTCGNEKAHEFDFWIGDWTVYSQQGLAGTNKIVAILDGCVLQETWAGAGGSAGSSLNFYNPTTQQWEQFWVWRNGTTLHLTGEYHDGQMIMEGSSPDANGRSIMNRITWTDNPDGTVRQLWEQSPDGETWTASFDGMYKKE